LKGHPRGAPRRCNHVDHEGMPTQKIAVFASYAFYGRSGVWAADWLKECAHGRWGAWICVAIYSGDLAPDALQMQQWA
jgi:hypothetical protein